MSFATLCLVTLSVVLIFGIGFIFGSRYEMAAIKRREALRSIKRYAAPDQPARRPRPPR